MSLAPLSPRSRKRLRIGGWGFLVLSAILALNFGTVGAQAFALHARFAVQGHTGDADWELIREMKATVSRPVIGNGDIRACYPDCS